MEKNNSNGKKESSINKVDYLLLKEGMKVRIKFWVEVHNRKK